MEETLCFITAIDGPPAMHTHTPGAAPNLTTPATNRDAIAVLKVVRSAFAGHYDTSPTNWTWTMARCVESPQFWIG
jgi:hypothetical protein